MRHFCGFLLHRRPPGGKAPGLTPAPQAFTPRGDAPARPAVPDAIILAGGRSPVNVTRPERRFTTGVNVGVLHRFLVADRGCALAGQLGHRTDGEQRVAVWTSTGI